MEKKGTGLPSGACHSPTSNTVGAAKLKKPKPSTAMAPPKPPPVKVLVPAPPWDTLLSKLLLGEFQTTSVHDVQLAVSCAQDNEGRPPGMSLQPKGYSHRAKSSPNPLSAPRH